MRPLPGGGEADLKAGDGVGYILPILHWPSNYTAKLRRTIHGGFTRTTHYPDLSWLDHVSPRAQETFTRWDARSHTYCEMADAALRAVIDGNAPAYRAALDRMWPGRGPKGLLHSTICLGKTATIIFNQHCRTVDELSEFDRGNLNNVHPMTMQWGPRLTDRFTPAEAMIIHERFKPIDDALRSNVELHPPGFRGRATNYHPHRVPRGLTVDSWLAGWND